jgi:heptosyltransferase-1/heptosyltransferase-2
VIPFSAPWTAFKIKHKYRLYDWPWREIFRMRKLVGRGIFDVALSARWDPRDHFLLAAGRARRRLGFPRLNSRMFLTQPLQRPPPEAHHYEYWRVLGRALGLDLPPRGKIPVPDLRGMRKEILIHTGAGQAVRVWPLEKVGRLAARLRQNNYQVRIACDQDQQARWLQLGERDVVVPRSVPELLSVIDRAAVFVGNDSGPGHLAAMTGVPTFTVFGPQLPEWFAPLHPQAEWIEGRACPYRPCSDYCFFPTAHCLGEISEDEVWRRVERFVARQISGVPSGFGLVPA